MHPTVKPVAMVADAMRDCSRRGEVILDPFMGSGTTIMAAERVGRRGFGLELDRSMSTSRYADGKPSPNVTSSSPGMAELLMKYLMNVSLVRRQIHEET